jgi:hypothetical protein
MKKPYNTCTYIIARHALYCCQYGPKSLPESKYAVSVHPRSREQRFPSNRHVAPLKIGSPQDSFRDALEFARAAPNA